MVVTLEGMVMLVSAVHNWKAPALIVVTLEPMVTDVKVSYFTKAFVAMLVTR